MVGAVVAPSTESEAVVAALRRLYSGDAVAGRELEHFQASPQALAIAVELLGHVVAEVQFFAACTLCRAASCGAMKAQGYEVNWLLAQACSCGHRPAARQLVSAAVRLSGSEGGVPLAMRAVELLGSQEYWQVALDILLVVEPSPDLPDVCKSLDALLGRGCDELLVDCALRYPHGIEAAAVGGLVEEAVRSGRVREVRGGARLSSAFRARVAAAARNAADLGHLDAAASTLQDLPGLGVELVEVSAMLLRSLDLDMRTASLELWSSAIRNLSEEQRLQAFEIFAPAFFVGATLPEDDADMIQFREGLWELVSYWQISTSKRLTLVNQAMCALEASLQGTADWRQAEAALWLLSRYAKSKRADVSRAADICSSMLQQLAGSSGFGSLVVTACALLREMPRVVFLPLLMDRRFANVQMQGKDCRAAIAGAVHACCVTGAKHLWDSGEAQAFVDELQRRAVAGEEGLVAAAAAVLVARGSVTPLAAEWARLCSELSPGDERLPARARALYSTIVDASVCVQLWDDCVRMLPHVPPETRADLLDKAVGYITEKPELAKPVALAWAAVWAQAEGDETLIASLLELVRATARTSAAAAPALEVLVASLARAGVWPPQVLDAALYTIQASVASAGSPWPLTEAVATAYSSTLSHAAVLASGGQRVKVLPLIGALASWGTDDTLLGHALRKSLEAQREAVQSLVAGSDDRTLAEKIARALRL